MDRFYLGRLTARRLLDLLSSFGVLHAVNTASNLLYSLALLVCISRVLSQYQYSEIVFLTAISFYIQPIDQALGRVLFSEIRGTRARKDGPGGYVTALLVGQATLLGLLAFCIPFSLAAWQKSAYQIDGSLYLLFALLANFWAFDLQSTSFALDLGSKFVRWSLVHRGCQFACLAVLWQFSNFDLFACMSAAIAAGFATFACLNLLRTIEMPRSESAQAHWGARGRRIGSSVLSGLADLTVLNAPYAVISFLYGVGPTLVIFDSVMKVARLVMAGSRTLTEIGLPRHSSFVAQLDFVGANRLFDRLVALSVLASALAAIAVMMDTSLVFSILLGPNNIVPQGAGIAASAIILATGLYQPAAMLMSFTSDHSAIARFSTVVFVIGSIMFLVIVMSKPTAITLLWQFALLLIASGFAAAFLGRRRTQRVKMVAS